MLNIKFITDSTSDIPRDFAAKYDIGVVGVRINFPEGNSVADWYEITHDEFYDYLERTNNIPSTSQPPIVEIADMFEKALEDHDAIIFVATSSNSSGSFNSARLAKESVLEKNPEAKIEIVDSQAFSLFETIMLEEGLKLQKKGKSILRFKTVLHIPRHYNKQPSVLCLFSCYLSMLSFTASVSYFQ